MKFEKNSKHLIYVKPKSSKSEIKIENNSIIVWVKSPPEKNKSNDEIIKLFKSSYGISIKIISGLKSKRKQILIE